MAPGKKGLRSGLNRNWCQILREMHTGARRTLRPGKTRRKVGTKGQPEGYTVISTTGKPWVAEAGLVFVETAGQNNSNPTLYAASAANGEWELILVNSSHYCFIQSRFLPLSFIGFTLMNIFDNQLADRWHIKDYRISLRF